MPAPVIALAALIDDLESQVQQARKAGGIDVILSLAASAMDQLEQAANDPAFSAADRQRAQNTARKLGYNSAADAWPFWESRPAARNLEQLRAARAIAVRVAALTAALPPDPKQLGNAAWLIGAFDLALGDTTAAQTHFQAARTHFEPVAEMRLMAEGYLALAGAPEIHPLETTIETLTTSTLPHAKNLAEQLAVAAASLRSHRSFQSP